MKLWQKVIIALILGIIAGFVFKENMAYLKPIGTVFVNLIKMVVIPLVFFTIISGITSMNDTGSFKRVGIKAIIGFLLTSTFAITVGLVFGNVFEPGKSVNMEYISEIYESKKVIEKPDDSVSVGARFVNTLVNMIPQNPIGAMSDGNIIQVVFFAVFTAFVIISIGKKGKRVTELCHDVTEVMMKMVDIIIKFSPYGVFALTGWVVGVQGMEILVALGRLAVTVSGALVFQYLVYGIIILFIGRISPLPFYRKMITPQSIAFSTSSSSATLSTTMKTVHEKIGVSQSSSSFILPLGASINMDGAAIYMAIAAVFFSQALGIPLGFNEYAMIILTSTIVSIGAAGIPGGSLIMMGVVFDAVGIPLEGIALVAGIDRVLDMMRTTLNITGDSVVAFLVDKSEGNLDEEVYFS